jgi:hypothetical protein
MARWDSIKARRCRSQAYNDDKDKAPVVSQRKERSRQETLEASSFTVVVAIKEQAAAEEGEEGVDGKGSLKYHCNRAVQPRLKRTPTEKK